MRVLIPTYTHSMVAFSTASDLRDVIASAGHSAGLLVMRGSCVTIEELKRGLSSLEYDMIVGVNMVRSDFHDTFPDGVPFVTLVQDAIPALETAERAARFNAGQNYLFGYSGRLLASGYDASRSMETRVPISPRKFFDERRFKRIKTNKKVDVFLASNKGEDPKKFLETNENAYENYGFGFEETSDFIDLLKRLYQDRRYWDKPMTTCECVCLWERNLGNFVDPMTRKLFESVIYYPLHERVYRQRVVADLIDDGYRVSVAGFGWSDNPCFSHVSAGVVPHGPDLADMYYSSRYSIHLNGNDFQIHHRKDEILLSGGTLGEMRGERDIKEERYTLSDAKRFLSDQHDMISAVLRLAKA